MSKWYEYEFSIESAANCHFKFSEDIDLRDYDIDKGSWDKLTELKKEEQLKEIADDIAFNWYINYGVGKKDE